MLPKQIETRLGPKSHHTLPQTTDPASEIDSQAFFSSIDSSFQSFCCRSSSCSWTDTFSSALSFAHWASMFERGIGATREEVAVGGADETSTWLTVAVTRLRRWAVADLRAAERARRRASIFLVFCEERGDEYMWNSKRKTQRQNTGLAHRIEPGAAKSARVSTNPRAPMTNTAIFNHSDSSSSSIPSAPFFRAQNHS